MFQLSFVVRAAAVVELFVELLMVRVAIVDRAKELPADMVEAITSLIYAAQVSLGACPLSCVPHIPGGHMCTPPRAAPRGQSNRKAALALARAGAPQSGNRRDVG